VAHCHRSGWQEAPSSAAPATSAGDPLTLFASPTLDDLFGEHQLFSPRAQEAPQEVLGSTSDAPPPQAFREPLPLQRPKVQSSTLVRVCLPACLPARLVPPILCLSVGTQRVQGCRASAAPIRPSVAPHFLVGARRACALGCLPSLSNFRHLAPVL
jgi:hypothetical protein